MAEQIRFRFIRRWQYLDWVFKKGDEICLPSEEVDAVRERMKVYGTYADLCLYRSHLVPLSWLEEIKDDAVIVGLPALVGFQGE